jgi:hypothetical protein
MAHPVLPELIWMADDRNGAKPPQLELLTHLLAAAVARDLQPPVVIVTLSRANGLRVEEWDGARFARTTQPLPQPPMTAGDLHPFIPAINPSGDRPGRVFVAHLDDPLHLPHAGDPQLGFDAQRTKFDRVVLVTDRIPESVRGEVRDLLDPNLMISKGVGFGGVTPSVPVNPSPPGFAWKRWLGLLDGTFATRDEPDDEEMGLVGSAGDRGRLFRDACYLTLDLPALAAQWAKWDAAGRPTATAGWVSR